MRRSGTPPRRGFSLLEILVALAVFAVASGMAWIGLGSVANTRQQLAATRDDFAAIQRSVNFLANDLATSVARPVRIGRSGQRPALAGNAVRVAFSRLGLASELQSRASAVQRVVWFLDGEELVRGHYPAIDRSDERALKRRTMATGVHAFSLRYLDRNGAWHDHWPLSGNEAEHASALPRAVEVRIDFSTVSDIRRVVILPAAVPVSRFRQDGES